MAGDVNGDGIGDILDWVRGLDSAGGTVGINGSNVGGAVVVFGSRTVFRRRWESPRRFQRLYHPWCQSER